MKIKSLLILASLGIISATAVGATAASWAVTDNADPFGIKISVLTPTVQHTVTFYKTFDNGSWGNSETITVNHGETLVAPVISLTGYTTLGWNETVPCLSCYTPYDEFKVENINNLPITKDMTLYPNIESNNDKVYINQLGYVGDVDTDITISTSNIGQTLIGKEYIGVTNGVCNPKASWNETRSLTSSTGIYKFSAESGAAVCRRKITFNIASHPNYWFDANAKFDVYCFNTSQNTWIKDAVSQTTTSKTYYVDCKWTTFIICRVDPSRTDCGWGAVWNQTVDAPLNSKDTGSAVYGSDHTTLYVQDTQSSEKANYNWW